MRRPPGGKKATAGVETRGRTSPRPPHQTRHIEIEAHIHEPGTMFFRIDVGKADLDGKTWEMSLNVGGNSPIIRLPDGRWVTFTWPALIVAANAAGAGGEK